MGKATRWLRGLLGGGGKKPSSATTAPPAPSSLSKEKKKWIFGRSSKEKERQIVQSQGNQPVPHAAVVDDGEQNKHAIAVAAATAAVAEAAVAAARAAAAVVRLTSSGRVSAGPGAFTAVAKREEWAAVKIQSAFRGYLARRALRALRGLVKLQALVRGNIVRKQMAETLRCMHVLVRAQAKARASRALSSADPRFNRSNNPHPGPPTPDKHDPSIRSNVLRPDRNGSLKKFLEPPVMDPIEGRPHPSGWNWLDRWMEERCMARQDYTTESMLGTAMDDDRNAKILEIDPGKPKQVPKCRSSSHHHSACSTLTSDLKSCSFATLQDSPSKDSTVAQMSIPSPSVDMPKSLSPLMFPIAVEASGLVDSPQFYSACSRPGSSRRGPFTPSKSDCSRSLFSGYSDYPNYMANTESSRAKARSQSAPRQRPEYEKSSSLRQASMNSFNQQFTSGVIPQRLSSLHAKFTNKAYPGSGRLDSLGMPVRM